MDIQRLVSDPNNYPFLSQIFSLLNLVLILMTATISYFSYRSARKANELQLLPLLAIYFKGKPMKDRKVRIRNIGKSPAYDIKIESNFSILTDIHKIWELSLTMIGTNLLVPDEERDLKIVATSNGEPAEMADFMIFRMDPEEEHDRERIYFVVSFRNAEGKLYHSKVETGKGGLFIRPAKRLGIMGVLSLVISDLKSRMLLVYYRKIWNLN